MAFKQKWYCEYCGYMVLSVEEPEDWDCPNSEDVLHKPVTFNYYNEPDETKPKWDKDELKERYRIAYHLRGGSWAGVQAYPWSGDSLAIGKQLCDEAKAWHSTEKKYALEQAIEEGR